MSSDIPPIHSHAAKSHASITDTRSMVYNVEDIKRLSKTPDDTFGLTVNPGFYLDKKQFSLIEDLSEKGTKQAKKAANIGRTTLLKAHPAPKL